MSIDSDVVTIKAQILHRLARARKWQHSHTAIENLEKGFPGHLRGAIKDMVKELIREDLILVKQTSYGTQVSLNFAKRKEIEHYLARLG